MESHKIPWFQTTNQYHENVCIYVYIYNIYDFVIGGFPFLGDDDVDPRRSRLAKLRCSCCWLVASSAADATRLGEIGVSMKRCTHVNLVDDFGLWL